MTPYHHAIFTARHWGGLPQDYLPVHEWLDQSKGFYSDLRHRALRHHAEGILLCESVLGPTLTNSEGRVVPVRSVAERHVQEDLGWIPTVKDWFQHIRLEPWMTRVAVKSRDLEKASTDAVAPGPSVGVAGHGFADLEEASHLDPRLGALKAMVDDGEKMVLWGGGAYLVVEGDGRYLVIQGSACSIEPSVEAAYRDLVGTAPQGLPLRIADDPRVRQIRQWVGEGAEIIRWNRSSYKNAVSWLIVANSRYFVTVGQLAPSSYSTLEGAVARLLDCDLHGESERIPD